MVAISPPLPAIAELAAFDQWEPWCKEPVPGQEKLTKVPYNLHTGFPGASTSPDVWISHDAVEQAIRTGRTHDGRPYDGKGFTVTKEDPYVEGDLDGCILPDGRLTPYAAKVLADVPTFFQPSPGGKGLRFIARLSKPLPANLGADITGDGNCRLELKQSGGYMTITDGHWAGTPDTIEDCTDALHRLYHDARNRRRAAQTKAKAEQRREHAMSHPIVGASGDSAYGLKALNDECADLASTSEGSRNTLLNKIAFRLGQLVAGNELTESTVTGELKAAARRAGLSDSEIEATFQSGFSHGLLNPRKPKPHKRLALMPIERDDDTTAAPSFSHIALTGEEFDALSEDEKRAAFQEAQALIGGMLNCIYAKHAKPNTRLVAVDTLVTSARRTVNGLSEQVTDPMPVCISQEYGVAARLGISENTVTPAYKAMHGAGLVYRYYEEDEPVKGQPPSDKQHLRLALKTAFLMGISQLVDKKPRESRRDSPTIGTGAHCPDCGSGDVDVQCRTCGTQSQLGELPAQTESPFANESPFAESTTIFVDSYLPIEERDTTIFVVPFANENVSANETTAIMFPALDVYTQGEPCEKCGCELYRSMAEYTVCIRCYPPRGYHAVSDQVDQLYPRQSYSSKRVQVCNPLQGSPAPGGPEPDKKQSKGTITNHDTNTSQTATLWL